MKPACGGKHVTRDRGGNDGLLKGTPSAVPSPPPTPAHAVFCPDSKSARGWPLVPSSSPSIPALVNHSHSWLPPGISCSALAPHDRSRPTGQHQNAEVLLALAMLTRVPMLLNLCLPHLQWTLGHHWQKLHVPLNLPIIEVNGEMLYRDSLNSVIIEVNGQML